MRDIDPASLAFVVQEPPAEAAAFREAAGSPHAFISDEDGALHEAFGVAKGTLAQFAGPTVIIRAFQASRNGFSMRKTTSNPRTLGAAFVLDQEGRIVWTRHARHAADNVSTDELTAALRSAQRS